LAKFQSPTAVSWAKIIQPERISKLICNLWLYTLLPKIKSISQIIVNKVVTTKYLAKFQRSITRPKTIGPERNVKLICNSSLYTHTTNIKSISQSIPKKVMTTVLFRNYGMTDMGNTICPGHLVAGTYTCYMVKLSSKCLIDWLTYWF
jgi:hypothetical protein